MSGDGPRTAEAEVEDQRAFEAHFGGVPRVREQAPGRVNLIGEHTDYSGGFVLPVAIPERVRVDLSPSGDDRVRVVSDNFDERGWRSYTLGQERRAGDWMDYVQGATELLGEQLGATGGFDALIRSSVPMGSGLASSAALEVALLRALRKAYALDLDDVALALLARRIENDFVGVPVGIMDPMAASLADEHTALFIDTRTLAMERLPLPPSVELVVIDSGVRHAHASGQYGQRRAECAHAAALLGCAELRDASGHDLERHDLPPPLDRRARHVITENARVLAAVAALRSGAVEALGALLVASHRSLRDDFEVSVPAVDRLVARALKEPGVHGARMTGGGFGGAIVILAERGWASTGGARVAAEVDGARVVTILGG